MYQPRGVIFLSNASAHGGAERYQTMLAGAWRMRGVPVTAFLSSEAGVDGWADELASRGARVRRDYSIYRWTRELADFSCREDRIVHANGSLPMKDNYFFLLAVAKTLGYRLVITEHGMPAPFPPGRGLRRLAPWRLRRQARVLRRRIEWRLADGIITVSQRERDHLVRNYGMLGQDCVAICNGADTRRFKPDEARRQAMRQLLGLHGRIVLGSVGRLDGAKGYHRLLEAAAALKHLPIDVLLVGDGPDGARLVDLAADLGLADRVHLAGRQEDVEGYLNAMDIFVLPSDAEAMPLSVIEAMSVGKPAVASAVGGINELVADGCSGYLVSPDNVEQLAEKLGKLANDGRLRREFGEEGRRRAVEFFGLQAMLDQTWAVYQRVLSEGRVPCRTTGMATA
jgi:glycosyltransferase involved in cell wall biosynthesis